MERLGKNLGRYLGETIEIGAILRDTEQAALKAGWQSESLTVSERLQLVTLRREVPHPRKRVYVSAGIHGDEPAGPAAVRQMMLDNSWPHDVSLWLCSCLNPEGFKLNRRENEAGIDLNRDYLHLQSDLVRAHVAWLKFLPQLDFAVCLHEDWEAQGFYLYELNPDQQPTVSISIIDHVRSVCPIDPSPEIDGRQAYNGVIYPNPDLNSRAQWPEAFYLVQNKTRLSYTLEAPSDFPLSVRVQALCTALKIALAPATPGRP